MIKVTFDHHLMIRHSCDLKFIEPMEVRGRGGGETEQKKQKIKRDGGGEESLGSWSRLPRPPAAKLRLLDRLDLVAGRGGGV